MTDSEYRGTYGESEFRELLRAILLPGYLNIDAIDTQVKALAAATAQGVIRNATPMAKHKAPYLHTVALVAVQLARPPHIDAKAYAVLHTLLSKDFRQEEAYRGPRPSIATARHAAPPPPDWDDAASQGDEGGAEEYIATRGPQHLAAAIRVGGLAALATDPGRAALREAGTAASELAGAAYATAGTAAEAAAGYASKYATAAGKAAYATAGTAAGAAAGYASEYAAAAGKAASEYATAAGNAASEYATAGAQAAWEARQAVAKHMRQGPAQVDPAVFDHRHPIGSKTAVPNHHPMGNSVAVYNRPMGNAVALYKHPVGNKPAVPNRPMGNAVAAYNRPMVNAAAVPNNHPMGSSVAVYNPDLSALEQAARLTTFGGTALATAGVVALGLGLTYAAYQLMASRTDKEAIKIRDAFARSALVTAFAQLEAWPTEAQQIVRIPASLELLQEQKWHAEAMGALLDLTGVALQPAVQLVFSKPSLR